MKKIILSLICLMPCFVFADSSTELNHEEHPEMRTIFQESYLHAEDNVEFLYFIASKVLNENESQLQPSDLVERFKDFVNTPEGEQRFLTLLAEFFDKEDLEQVEQLLHNEQYMTYRNPILFANFACHGEALEVMEEIVKEALTKPIQLPLQTSYEIIEISEKNFSEVLKDSPYLVIDVYADWCGPCKVFAPIFEEINKVFGAQYQFAKLNVDKCEKLTDLLKIESFPTILFFKDGKEVGREEGFMSPSKFKSKLSHYFN